MLGNVSGRAPPDRARLWLRFVARAIVLLWGAAVGYFVTASALDLTDPRDVLTRLVPVGSIAGMLMLGLLLAVWRWPRVAAWLLFGLAAVLAVFTTWPVVWTIVHFGRFVPLGVLVGGLSTALVAALPPLVGGWLVRASTRPAAPPGRGLAGRLDALALPVGLVLLGLTIVALVGLVIGNLPEVAGTWLLWLNVAFLALLAGLLGWQLQEAWTGTHAASPGAGS